MGRTRDGLDGGWSARLHALRETARGGRRACNPLVATTLALPSRTCLTPPCHPRPAPTSAAAADAMGAEAPATARDPRPPGHAAPLTASTAPEAAGAACLPAPGHHYPGPHLLVATTPATPSRTCLTPPCPPALPPRPASPPGRSYYWSPPPTGRALERPPPRATRGCGGTCGATPPPRPRPRATRGRAGAGAAFSGCDGSICFLRGARWRLS